MALDEIEQLRQVAQKDPSQLVRLADLLVAAGRAEEAIGACRKGLARRPEDVPLRLALGRALSAAGQLEEAQAALFDAVARQQRRGGGAARPLGAPSSRSQAASEWQNRVEEGSGLFKGAGDDVPTSVMRAEQVSALALQTSPSPSQLPRADSALEITEKRKSLAEVASALLDKWPDEAPEEAEPEADEMAQAWDARRARAFLLLWIALFLLTGGLVGGYIYRARERDRLLGAAVARADMRALEATYDANIEARDAYLGALRAEPHAQKYFAMVALAAARLTADDGEDSDATAWTMLRRAEHEGQKRRVGPDPRVENELRHARALLAMARGENCPPFEPKEDGDLAARCALQRGDLEGGRRILNDTIRASDEKDLRAMRALGFLELGNGDLDAADAVYKKMLALHPDHPAAVVGRLMVAIERGESPTVVIPDSRLGPTTEAWFHLASGLMAATSRGGEERAEHELEAARQGIVHDGRLASLYGRARLQQGKIGEAEQAMRVAERLAPNDSDVAVLDAEVALAKGFEEKVVAALSVGPATPRKLAVLGRAQCLTGKYKEARATLDAALGRRPGDAVSITYRAIAKAHLGEAGAAVKELERAASTLSSTTPYYGLGLIAYEKHELGRARAALSRALVRNSESFRARALLGRILKELGKSADALSELERAAKEAPAILSVHATLGQLLVDFGRDREARSELGRVITGGKAAPEDRLAFAEATVHLGWTAEGARAIEEAALAGVAAQRLANLRLELQSRKGPKEALLAAKALEKSRKGPAAKDRKFTLLLGQLWQRAGDLKKAADLYRSAVPADALHANLGLGRVALVQNDLPTAEGAYRAALKAVTAGPFGVDDETEARIGLGRALLGRKALSEALSILEPTAERDPQSAEARYYLARAYVENGDQEKARLAAERAVTLDDRFGKAYLLLGDLSKTDHKDRGRMAYKRFLELSPGAPESKAVKKSLAALK